MSLSRRMPRTILAAATSAIMITGLVAPSATAFTGSSMGNESSVGQPGGTKAPKNIIYMIGDGMGYNHVAAANLYESGQTRYQVEGEAGSELSELPGEAVQVYEGDKWNQLALSTFQHGNSYEPDRAWAEHGYVKESATDSAAAGTAMATGKKTLNGKVGVDENNAPVENTSERAKAEGKAAGVVSSVPFSHATPAAWAAHNPNRNDLNNMAEEMINSDLDVIMGAGHPFFDNDSQRVTTADEDYMTAKQYERLVNGETGFNFIEEDSDFEALANGALDGERYFGLAQVADTLQHDRSGNSLTPYDLPQNDVVDLATMSEGALNVLNQDEDGFHLMIEGGAIDWAGHANDIARDIEEVQAFNEAVETVVTWVEENSSWDETLVIVTADHETGYLSGQDELPDFKALTGEVGEVPAHEYYSGGHTNLLVPFFFRGAGSGDILRSTTGTDPVRGEFIDNVTVANLTLDKWWVRN
jgi:alkaline phosphatase